MFIPVLRGRMVYLDVDISAIVSLNYIPCMSLKMAEPAEVTV